MKLKTNKTDGEKESYKEGALNEREIILGLIDEVLFDAQVGDVADECREIFVQELKSMIEGK